MNRRALDDSLVQVSNTQTQEREQILRETDFRQDEIAILISSLLSQHGPANITRIRCLKLHMPPVSTHCASVAVNLSWKKGNKTLCHNVCSFLPLILQTQTSAVPQGCGAPFLLSPLCLQLPGSLGFLLLLLLPLL